MSVETLNLSSILSTISCAPSFLAPRVESGVFTDEPTCRIGGQTLPCLGQKPAYNENQRGHRGAVMDSFWFTGTHAHTLQFQVHISQRNAAVWLYHSFVGIFNFASTACTVWRGRTIL